MLKYDADNDVVIAKDFRLEGRVSQVQVENLHKKSAVRNCECFNWLCTYQNGMYFLHYNDVARMWDYGRRRP